MITEASLDLLTQRRGDRLVPGPRLRTTCFPVGVFLIMSVMFGDQFWFHILSCSASSFTWLLLTKPPDRTTWREPQSAETSGHQAALLLDLQQFETVGLQSVCDGGFGSAELCCSAITDTVKSVFNSESASHYSLHVFMSLHLRKPLFKAGERVCFTVTAVSVEDPVEVRTETSVWVHQSVSFVFL